MSWWKAVLLDLAIVLVMSGMVAITLRQWLEQREQKRWPTVTATIESYKQGPGFKGRQATYLVGHYVYGGEMRPFSVVWDLSDLGDGSWVPPPDTPHVGGTILLHVDPGHSSVVALDCGPRLVTTVGTFAMAAALVLLFSMMGIAVWYLR